MRCSTVAISSLTLALAFACDSNKPAPAKKSKPASSPATDKAAPVEAKKPPAMAPAPEGTIAIDQTYVHTCADEARCPEMLQDAGLEHCASLQLGSLTWRLPTIEELEAWKGRAELHAFDVFHWSGSVWDEDPAQFWIYDPGSGSKTTAKPDRKPFTIRCVAQPTD